MAWIRALMPVVLAGCCAAAAAQTASAPPAVREKVDVRAMVPGPQASEAATEPRTAGGLSRDQRKEATLQARQEGSLQPAGDAAEARDVRPVVAGAEAARPISAKAPQKAS